MYTFLCIRCSRQISHKGVYGPHTTYIHLGPHFGRPVFKKCGIIPKKQYRGCGYLILPVNRLKSCKKQQNTWVWNSHLLKKCVPLIFLGQTSLINPYVYDKEKKRIWYSSFGNSWDEENSGVKFGKATMKCMNTFFG